MSFVYIPYFFPLALIGDFVVVILYNKLCFGHFYGKYDFEESEMLSTNGFVFQ